MKKSPESNIEGISNSNNEKKYNNSVIKDIRGKSTNKSINRKS